MRELECNREILGIAIPNLSARQKKSKRERKEGRGPKRTNQMSRVEITSYCRPGEISFLLGRVCEPRVRTIPGEALENLKYSRRIQRKFTASRLARQMHTHATASFLARANGQNCECFTVNNAVTLYILIPSRVFVVIKHVILPRQVWARYACFY